MCVSIVSVLCHGHGLRVYLPANGYAYVCVLVRWGRRRSYVLLVVWSVLIRFWMDDMLWLWIAACLPTASAAFHPSIRALHLPFWLSRTTTGHA